MSQHVTVPMGPYAHPQTYALKEATNAHKELVADAKFLGALPPVIVRDSFVKNMERYPNVPNDIADDLSTISFDDPAFSANPSFHPDYLELSTIPSSDPPPYEVLVSPEPPNNSHIRQPASASVSSLGSESASEKRGANRFQDEAGGSVRPPLASASTHPSSPSLNSARSFEQPQEELLAYLQDDGDRDDPSPSVEREIPKSLLPGRPTYPRVAAFDQFEGRASDVVFPGSISLSGPAQRSVSAPPVSAGNGRPRPSRHGTTTSARPQTNLRDLDCVDELDETSPLAYHHRGPYEVQGMLDTPPARVPSLQPEQFMGSRRVLVEDNSLAVAPAPVPFKLNLKPGEFLARMPSIRSQQLFSPAQTDMAYAHQSSHRSADALAGNRLPYYLSQRKESNDWSPERLYEEAGASELRRALGTQATFNTDSARAQPVPRRPSPASMPNRQSVRFIGDQGYPDNPITPFQQSRQGSPSVPHSLQVNSSNASIYSESSSQSRSLGPPSSSDRFRPKRIVMPTPLQSQQALLRPVLGPSNSTSPNPPTVQASAALIPMRDQKKGNLLKKRTSMKPSLQHIPNESHNLPYGPGDDSRNQVIIPEQKVPKTGRKLSKRKT